LIMHVRNTEDGLENDRPDQIGIELSIQKVREGDK
jgi:hypothetical protein